VPRVLFTRAAQADLDDALHWYEAHAPRMVPEFRASLSAVVQRIEANPKQFPPAPRATRRPMVRRFPYLVIFRETPDAVYVVAVFHTSRDPRIWHGRPS
jgi:plasmid stabilization system protein ParE